MLIGAVSEGGPEKNILLFLLFNCQQHICWLESQICRRLSERDDKKVHFYFLLSCSSWSIFPFISLFLSLSLSLSLSLLLFVTVSLESLTA
jgi:hypothetical protein